MSITTRGDNIIIINYFTFFNLHYMRALPNSASDTVSNAFFKLPFTFHSAIKSLSCNLLKKLCIDLKSAEVYSLQ